MKKQRKADKKREEVTKKVKRDHKLDSDALTEKREKVRLVHKQNEKLFI